MLINPYKLNKSWKSVWTSAIASHVAANKLAQGGLFLLPGAAPVCDGGTAGMIAYGIRDEIVFVQGSKFSVETMNHEIEIVFQNEADRKNTLL